jgi:hypothetical protein
MGYDLELARDMSRIDPASLNNRAWAESELAVLMEEFNLSREDALVICEKYAPTIYRWVISG